mmetsp:Transcript_22070/g.45963  ORF Transcript_22070/g.45963 Transcript_22070/m.45963 type:complete len:124 (+) Transcript_22070:20-391(+)
MARSRQGGRKTSNGGTPKRGSFGGRNNAKSSRPTSGGRKQRRPLPNKSKGKPKPNSNKKKKKEAPPKPKTAEELDAEMDNYWLNSKDKAIAGKKLDDDMDAYWANKEEKKDEEEAPAAEESKE